MKFNEEPYEKRKTINYESQFFKFINMSGGDRFFFSF